jgi:AcrR family transcriptional regulator
MKHDTKQQILNVTVKMLLDENEPASITVRDIAAEANVQLAMINYYFQSKDELMYQAVGVLRDKMAWDWISGKKEGMSAYDQLRKMMISICDMSVKYSQYMRFTVEYELTKAKIAMPQYLIPLIREICGEKHSETGIRIIAYEIISTLQLIFFRSGDLWDYFGFDVLEYDRMVEIVDTLLAIHFPKEASDEVH